MFNSRVLLFCNIDGNCLRLLVLQDIASKIMAFSQEGPRTVCILSANGAVCNVTLRQPAMSGGTVTYEVCTEWAMHAALVSSFKLNILSKNLSHIIRSNYLLFPP